MRAKPIPIKWHFKLSIFASEPFLKSVGDDYGWLGGFDPAGKLRCILPYTIVKKAIFKLVRFRVETMPIDEELSIGEEKAFLNSAVDYFKSQKLGAIIPATTNTIFRTFPDGAIAAPYGSYIIDLTQPEEDIFGKFNTSHRRKVRQAGKKGVRIDSGSKYLEPAYTLVRDTFKRSNLPFMSLEAFKRMVDGLGDNIKIMVALHEGNIQGCVVIPFSLYSAYYVYGGSILRPVNGATNILHWEAMRLLKNMGVRKYDFVGVRIEPKKGSKQEGLATYKSRFGGELVQGYLWKYNLKKLQYFAYSSAVKAMRGGDIVDVEKHKLFSEKLVKD